ncbi:unnamed protein product, partial [Choristocarpus tenellus]
MKRSIAGATESGAASSPAPPPAQRQKVTAGDSGEDEKMGEGSFFLKQQNRALVTEMRRLKRSVQELEKELAKSRSRQGHFDATLSAVNRAWNQVTSDLHTAISTVIEPESPLNVVDMVKAEKVKESGGGKGKGGDKHAKSAGGQPSTLEGRGLEGGSETSLLEKVLLPAAKILMTDAADSSTADFLSKSKEPDVKDDESAASTARLLVRGVYADMDTDGYGVSAGQGGGKEGGVKLEDVSRGMEQMLGKKVRFTVDMAQRLVAAMQKHVGVASVEVRSQALKDMHAQLLGQKRRLTAETNFMSDQLSSARARCQELSDSLAFARLDNHKALRKLDVLASRGVEIPNDYAAAGSSNQGRSGARTGASALGGEGAGGTGEAW